MSDVVAQLLVAHEVRDDISPAAQYGRVRYVNGRYVHADECDEATGEIPLGFLARMEEAVVSFDPATDYLVIVGDHLQVAILAAMLGARYDRFRLLRYDRQARGYFPVTVDLTTWANATIRADKEANAAETHFAKCPDCGLVDCAPGCPSRL